MHQLREDRRGVATGEEEADPLGRGERCTFLPLTRIPGTTL